MIKGLIEILRLFGAYIMLTLPIQICLLSTLVVYIQQKIEKTSD